MKSFFSLILFLSITCSFAQTIHVSLVDATTGKAVTGAKVKSQHDHDLITFANDSGYFAFNLEHNDTILIQKDYYYPVYMGLIQHNFDSTHVVRLKLTPSANLYKGSYQFSRMDLQAFEYHFTHDTIGTDSHVSVIIFQTPDAIKAQETLPNTPMPLTIGTVDIFTHQSQNKGRYTLKK